MIGFYICNVVISLNVEVAEDRIVLAKENARFNFVISILTSSTDALPFKTLLLNY